MRITCNFNAMILYVWMFFFLQARYKYVHPLSHLQTTLHASSPSVWLPYAALDHLQVALQGAQSDTFLAEVWTCSSIPSFEQLISQSAGMINILLYIFLLAPMYA